MPAGAACQAAAGAGRLSAAARRGFGAGRAARGARLAAAEIGGAVGIAGHIAGRTVAVGAARWRDLGDRRVVELRLLHRAIGGTAA